MLCFQGGFLRAKEGLNFFHASKKALFKLAHDKANKYKAEAEGERSVVIYRLVFPPGL